VLDNPRASFADHVRSTQWTELQLAYFVGYAMHNYMTTPFCFTWPGFKTRELDEHRERGELWRVLEVTFPDDFATHSKVHKYYFDDRFMLQRIDYTADVLKGTAVHYCFDHKEFGGIAVPTLRRISRRDPETNRTMISGPSSFFLDYVDVSILDQ